jgi:hypothetical protein
MNPPRMFMDSTVQPTAGTPTSKNMVSKQRICFGQSGVALQYVM